MGIDARHTRSYLQALSSKLHLSWFKRYSMLTHRTSNFKKQRSLDVVISLNYHLRLHALYVSHCLLLLKNQANAFQIFIAGSDGSDQATNSNLHLHLRCDVKSARLFSMCGTVFGLFLPNS